MTHSDSAATTMANAFQAKAGGFTALRSIAGAGGFEREKPGVGLGQRGITQDEFHEGGRGEMTGS